MKRIAVVLGVMFAFTAHAGIWENGKAINGIHLNGIWSNGINLNGIWQNGVWQNGDNLNGTRMQGVKLNSGDASKSGLKVQNATTRNGKLYIRVAK